jgi:hypothetical protein
VSGGACARRGLAVIGGGYRLFQTMFDYARKMQILGTAVVSDPAFGEGYVFLVNNVPR